MGRAAIPKRPPTSLPTEGDGNPISRVRAGLAHMGKAFSDLLHTEPTFGKNNPFTVAKDVIFSSPNPTGKYRDIGPHSKPKVPPPPIQKGI